MATLTNIELKQEQKRQIISTIITFIIYLVIFLLLVFFSDLTPKPKDEIIITKVKLADKIREDNEKLGNQNKTNIPKEIKKKGDVGNQTAKKGDGNLNLKDNKQDINKTEQTKSKDVSVAIKTENSNLSPNQKVETKEREKTFENYNEVENANKKKLEEEFFSNANSGKKSGTQVDDLDENDLENLLAKIGTGSGGKANTNVEGSKNSNLNGDILWSGGRDRKLLIPLVIIPPKEIAESGVRPKSVKISFIVFENGRVAEANIIRSTGNPSWDNAILSEFKRNAIFEEADLKSSGVINIEMKYN